MKEKLIKIIISTAILLILLPLSSAFAEDLLSPPFGYADANNDGINDLFQDANGDGIDDVSKKKYRHSFQFKDGNGDGKNDLFSDSNGDGVNDLFVPGTRARSRGIQPFMDVDDDGRNDVTGTRLQGFGYGKRDGWQNGFDDFIDEDGDGIDDRRMWKRGWRNRHGSKAKKQKRNGKDNESDSGNKNDDSGKKKKGQ